MRVYALYEKRKLILYCLLVVAAIAVGIAVVSRLSCSLENMFPYYIMNSGVFLLPKVELHRSRLIVYLQVQAVPRKPLISFLDLLKVKFDLCV